MCAVGTLAGYLRYTYPDEKARCRVCAHRVRTRVYSYYCPLINARAVLAGVGVASAVAFASSSCMRAVQAARQRSPCSDPDSQDQDLIEQWAECDRIRAFSSWVVFCYHAARRSTLLATAGAWRTRRALQDTFRAWSQRASSQPRLWTPSRGTNAEIGRLLLDVSERRQLAMRLLASSAAAEPAEASHTETAASDSYRGSDAASRLAEKAPGEGLEASPRPPLSPPEVLVQRLWGDARRDLEREREHERRDRAWEASKWLEEAPPPRSPPAVARPMASDETGHRLTPPGRCGAAPSAVRPCLPGAPSFPGAPSCPTRSTHSAGAARRPRPEDAHCRQRAVQAENAARRLRQQQRARAAERREVQLAEAERGERAAKEAARWRQLMAAREEARRPAREREAAMQAKRAERRRAEALRTMRDRAAREACRAR